jgi:hypothetical protein
VVKAESDQQAIRAVIPPVLVLQAIPGLKGPVPFLARKVLEESERGKSRAAKALSSRKPKSNS